MTTARPAPVRLLTLLALPLLAAPLSADLLVLRDGARLETRGPWREKGRQIVFTDVAGRLSALRADEVDLAASRAATAEAAAPKRAEPLPKSVDRPVILVLDETDLGLGSDPDLSGPPAEIVLYATSWCGWCRKTRELFAELGVEYVEKDVEASSLDRLERNQLTGGDESVPVVNWRGETVRGFAEERFRALAREERDVEAARQRARDAAPSGTESSLDESPPELDGGDEGDGTEPPPLSLQPAYGS